MTQSHFFKTSLILSCALTLIHCSPQSMEKQSLNTDSSQQNIVGGAVVAQNTLTAHSVVFLISRKAEGISLCTGVLIERNFVLTAAHCVYGLTAKSVYAIFDNQPAKNLSKSNRILPVSELQVHPSFTFNQNIIQKILPAMTEGGDLALLKLSHDAPEEWIVTPLATEFFDPKTTPIHAAGFGIIKSQEEGDQDSSGILREVTLHGLSQKIEDEANSKRKKGVQKIVESLQSSLGKATADKKDAITKQIRLFKEIVGLPTFFPSDERADLLFVDQSEGRGICHGDSGGAAFVQVDGKNQVVGIASRVQNDRNSEDECSFIGMYTNVLPYLDWINDTKAQMKAE